MLCCASRKKQDHQKKYVDLHLTEYVVNNENEVG